MKRVSDLRESFLEFFREREHRILPSSSIIPRDDPTLLFTTAGMVQFKPMFAGTVRLDYTRAATVQKCLRTSDLENVGKTKRHCTFFEMLGNFSFGDYFKDEAIAFAWDYSTGIIGFPAGDIWVSIYEDDDEAFSIWNKKIGIPEKKIVRLGKKDNFWGPAGDSGACGPCSELYLDRGPAYGCGKPGCKPGCDCERFLEFWNLVFNQFYQDTEGRLSPLPRTGIDTGMGLERLATLVQRVDSIYQTDELKSLVDFVCREQKVSYAGDAIAAVNVMVEHCRALTFAISDGVYPSNDGRGYVLRRILRRALRFGRQIGVKEPFIYKMVDPLVSIMGRYYPEVVKGSVAVKKVLEGEEVRFLETLENGMDRLEETMKSLLGSGGKAVPGRDAFVLYDTFGFPLEMTMEIAAEKGLSVDVKGFEAEMEKQRERGKQSWKSGDAGLERVFEALSMAAGDTRFTGYELNDQEARIVALAGDGGPVEKLAAGAKGCLVLDETPFYGESGGQVGDRGIIRGETLEFRVDDTKKAGKTVIHIGEVTSGEAVTGARVRAGIDVLRRNLTRANHTATHLLQAALRRVLGTHVHQTGSFVEPERMRFDFAHFQAMTGAEIGEVESIVNARIWEALPVSTELKNRAEAVSMGAMAVFDEKYEDEVRVVSVADFSKELCGGTHVDNTGKIGVFKILREASPGAGMRRIEAVTLKGVLDRFLSQQRILESLSASLNAAEADMVKKVEDMLERQRALEKELERKKAENLASGIDEMIAMASSAGTTKIVRQELAGVEAEEMRTLADLVRSRLQDSVVLLGSRVEDRVVLLFAATQTAVGRGADCGGLIKQVSKLVGGGGGGRKDMAQAGGKKPEGISQALDEAVKLVSGKLSS